MIPNNHGYNLISISNEDFQVSFRRADYQEASWFWLQKENIPLYLAGENWSDSKANGFSLPQLVAHLIGSIVLSTGTVSCGAAFSATANGDTLALSGTHVIVLLLLTPPPLYALPYREPLVTVLLLLVLLLLR